MVGKRNIRENIITKTYHKYPKILTATAYYITAKCTLAPTYDPQTSNPQYFEI